MVNGRQPRAAAYLSSPGASQEPLEPLSWALFPAVPPGHRAAASGEPRPVLSCLSVCEASEDVTELLLGILSSFCFTGPSTLPTLTKLSPRSSTTTHHIHLEGVFTSSQLQGRLQWLGAGALDEDCLSSDLTSATYWLWDFSDLPPVYSLVKQRFKNSPFCDYSDLAISMATT